MCIEDALRTLRDRLTTVQVFADLMAQDPNAMQPRALSGLADICEDMAVMLLQVSRAMPLKALAVELPETEQPANSV